MGWEEALAVVIERTGHRRYAELCADDHPDRDAWRRRMTEKATGTPPAAAQALRVARRPETGPTPPPAIRVDYGTAEATGPTPPRRCCH